MKKVIALLSILYSFLIFGTALNINFKWPWQKENTNTPITYPIRSTNNINYQIKLIQGDLLNISDVIQPNAKISYTIVNAANKFLYLGGGIAGAIKDADKRGTVQQACDNLLQEKGKDLVEAEAKSTGLLRKPKIFEKYMPIGSAWLTPSGDLEERNIQAIIHAVGPNCQIEQERNDFESFLRMVYGNIFAAVIHHNATQTSQPFINTIACPSLSTGIFACDLRQSAAIAAEMIFSIMNDIAQSNNPNAPTTFVMVAYDDKNFQIYKDAFKNVAQNINGFEQI